MYYYEFMCGTAYFHAYGLDDKKARKLLARWIRLCWNKYRAHNSKGSIADYIDSATDSYATAAIARTWVPRSVVPYTGRVIIEKFDMSPESINEFMRVPNDARTSTSHCT